MADTWDYDAVRNQVADQHREVCKAIGKVYDRIAEIKDSGGEVEDRDKNPNVWIDETRAEDIDAGLRIYMECNDCGASGFIDISDDPSLHVRRPTPKRRIVDDRANLMGGTDVSEKYKRSK